MYKGVLSIYRFFELMFTEVAASLCVVLLEYLGFWQKKLFMVICIFALLIAFVVINFVLSLHLYDFVASVKWYLILNFSAYIVFGALQVAIYKLTSRGIYIRLFAITNFLYYSRLGVSAVISAVVFHALGFLTIISVPILFMPPKIKDSTNK